ncbi:MAG TPA: hypothetical protein VI248_19055 [Kineosporiaceae bacterium]
MLTGRVGRVGASVVGVGGGVGGLKFGVAFDELAAFRAFRRGPLVTFARCRTVAKVDAIGLVVRGWIHCSAG